MSAEKTETTPVAPRPAARVLTADRSPPTVVPDERGLAVVTRVAPAAPATPALARSESAETLPASPAAAVVRPTRVVVNAGVLEPAGVVRSVARHARHHLLAVLVAFCVAAAAVYGALTLLRELAGFLAIAAVVLLVIVGVFLFLRASLFGGNPRSRPAAGGDEGANAGT